MVDPGSDFSEACASQTGKLVHMQVATLMTVLVSEALLSADFAAVGKRLSLFHLCRARSTRRFRTEKRHTGKQTCSHFVAAERPTKQTLEVTNI